MNFSTLHLTLTILFGVSFGWFAVVVAKWHLWANELLNFKPFSCPSCLGAWSAYFMFFAPDFVLYPLTVLFTAGTLATFLNLLYEKIK